MYGDPDALDELAAGLRARATAVREYADDHLRRCGAARWVSTAADAFRAQVAADHAAAYRAAADVDRAAAVLRAHADQVRDTLSLIRRFEREVAQWAERRARGVRDRVGHRLTGGRPAPGDPGGLDVGRYLHAEGGL